MDDLLFEVTDAKGRLVSCTRDCWFNHILPRHPFMSNRLEMVKTALVEPTFGIFRDAHFPDRFIYYYRQTGPRYLKVVVRELEGRFEVVTAFDTDSMKQGEKLI